MSADVLAATVARHLASADVVRTLGLRPETVQVRPLLNLAGFTNASFTVLDGTTAYHLKLTAAPHRIARLRRWHALRELLETRYRAPHVVAWASVPGTPYEGLLFEQLAGR